MPQFKGHPHGLTENNNKLSFSGSPYICLNGRAIIFGSLIITVIFIELTRMKRHPCGVSENQYYVISRALTDVLLKGYPPGVTENHNMLSFLEILHICYHHLKK